MDSRVTMGAAASKKCNLCTPGSASMAPTKASSVSGPVARMAGASGMASTTWPVAISISGSLFRISVTRRENASRSTASAPPAGTRAHWAQLRISESSRAISALSRPEALVRCSALSELEQTSSEKLSSVWAGECFFGFISTRRTGMPRRASCQAASHPASPAPTTVTLFIFGRAYGNALFAVFVHAQVIGVALGVALEHHAASAIGALVGHRHIPGNKLAGGIILTAVKMPAALAHALVELAAAFGTGRVNGLEQRLRVLAFGEVGAGEEAAISETSSLISTFSMD